MELIDEAMQYAHAEESKDQVQPLFDAVYAYITNAIGERTLKKMITILFSAWP